MCSLARLLWFSVCLALGVAISIHRCGAQVNELRQGCPTELDASSVPKYDVVRHEYAATTPPKLDLYISISTEAFNQAAMLKLACKLASEFSKETTMSALIFDDKQAARNLALYHTDQPRHAIYLWHLRGHFELDRRKGEQFIDYVTPEQKDGLLNLKRTRISIVPDQ